MIEFCVCAMVAAGSVHFGAVASGGPLSVDISSATRPEESPLAARQPELLFHFEAAPVNEDVALLRLIGKIEPISLSAIQEETKESVPVPPYGTKDSMRFNVYGGYGQELGTSSNKEYLLGVGWELFIEDNLSLSIELNNFYFDQSIENAYGFNLNFLMRWHLLRWEWGTLYGDLGAGMMVTTVDVPNPGSQFSFTPQLGAGFSFDLGEDRRLLLGGRWHHVSNARLFEDNPGRDFFQVYVGISVSW